MSARANSMATNASDVHSTAREAAQSYLRSRARSWRYISAKFIDECGPVGGLIAPLDCGSLPLCIYFAFDCGLELSVALSKGSGLFYFAHIELEEENCYRQGYSNSDA